MGSCRLRAILCNSVQPSPLLSDSIYLSADRGLSSDFCLDFLPLPLPLDSLQSSNPGFFLLSISPAKRSRFSRSLRWQMTTRGHFRHFPVLDKPSPTLCDRSSATLLLQIICRDAEMIFILQMNSDENNEAGLSLRVFQFPFGIQQIATNFCWLDHCGHVSRLNRTSWPCWLVTIPQSWRSDAPRNRGSPRAECSSAPGAWQADDLRKSISLATVRNTPRVLI